MQAQEEYNRAGFWLRVLATWVDCLVIFLFLKAVFYLILYTGLSLYFPFNFTFFVVGLIYSVWMIAWKGQTIGKYLMGLTVKNKDGEKLYFRKAVWRETILKFLSAVILFLGFLWIGFTREKKAWHDSMVGSIVIKNKRGIQGGRIWKGAAFLSFVLFFGSYIWNITSTLAEAGKMEINTTLVQLPFMNRGSSGIIDVSQVKDTSFVSWIDKNGQTPEAYALQVASANQVTLFGEEHENSDNLDFFNRMIPKLYHQSGVRVIGMEIIPDIMNSKLESLVNGKTFDSILALEIARTQCWKMWGYKEYWEILHTVWQLNQSLPANAEKMSIVGLDTYWCMPDISLLGISQDSKGKTAFYEKFRFFSVIDDIPKISQRDKLMARNVEKEIILKHRKGVVWIGFNHTFMNFAPTIKANNKTIVQSPRFAVLLSQKYRNTFFQVELFQHLNFAESDTLCRNGLNGFIDSIMNRRNNEPVGFSVAASPFENLNDHCLTVFTKYPSLSYGDLAQGLIFLKPPDNRTECTWQSGYISDEMFMKYKPMYELVFGKKLQLTFKNAAELNLVLEKWLGKKG